MTRHPAPRAHLRLFPRPLLRPFLRALLRPPLRRLRHPPLLPLALALAVGGQSASAADAAATHRVVDPTGRTVTVPTRVERIGCLTGAAYEKAFLVGAGDKVVVRQATNPPWMEQTNPAVRRIPVIVNAHQPNIEELLKERPDVLFSWDDPALTHTLEARGLTVVSPQPNRRQLASAQDFFALLKAEVGIYGQVLGPDAERRAQEWNRYFDRITQLVAQRTADLRPEQRPTAYYLRGPSALNTQGADSNLSWFGEVAGADMVVRHSTVQDMGTVSMEQMMIWNPEVIFVGRQYSPDLVLHDPRWQQIRAVRNKRVYVIPDGVFFWDSSSEGVLLLLYMAKTLHPERFQDIDLAREVQDYYRKFYGYRLSDTETRLLLGGYNPQGQRFNPRGN
jgi:iron complex transport system substrate-binding protein